MDSKSVKIVSEKFSRLGTFEGTEEWPLHSLPFRQVFTFFKGPLAL
jgi:hypothetical protein